MQPKAAKRVGKQICFSVITTKNPIQSVFFKFTVKVKEFSFFFSLKNCHNEIDFSSLQKKYSALFVTVAA
jgi:hypothetical protein